MISANVYRTTSRVLYAVSAYLVYKSVSLLWSAYQERRIDQFPDASEEDDNNFEVNDYEEVVPDEYYARDDTIFEEKSIEEYASGIEDVTVFKARTDDDSVSDNRCDTAAYADGDINDSDSDVSDGGDNYIPTDDDPEDIGSEMWSNDPRVAKEIIDSALASEEYLFPSGRFLTEDEYLYRVEHNEELERPYSTSMLRYLTDVQTIVDQDNVPIDTIDPFLPAFIESLYSRFEVVSVYIIDFDHRSLIECAIE